MAGSATATATALSDNAIYTVVDGSFHEGRTHFCDDFYASPVELNESYSWHNFSIKAVSPDVIFSHWHKSLAFLPIAFPPESVLLCILYDIDQQMV